MIDKELSKELRARYSPDGSDLRKAQLSMVGLLEFLDRICREHGLRYWIDYGTLIGAMRHGGFIPWDDDTDVSMPREDALKLREIMGDKVFDGHIFLQTPENDPHYNHSSWFTLRDLDSEYHQDLWSHNQFKYRGLQVDIFFVEENINPRLANLSKYIQLMAISWPNENIAHTKFLRPFLRPIHNFLDGVIYPLFRKFKKNDGMIRQGIGSPFHLSVSAKDIYPLQRINFEGAELNAPHNPATVLTSEYGDWEKIPEEGDRATHNVIIEFFK